MQKFVQSVLEAVSVKMERAGVPAKSKKLRGRTCRIEELEGREMLSVTPWTLTNDISADTPHSILAGTPLETEYRLKEEGLKEEGPSPLAAAPNGYHAGDWAKVIAIPGLGVSEENPRGLNDRAKWNNVGGMLRLVELNVAGMELSGKLDLAGCDALEDLRCSYNLLTTLNLSGCKSLNILVCGNSRLEELDVSDCVALTEIHCWFNQLTKLDVSKNTALVALNCNDNQLTELDASRCVNLFTLNCEKNQLTRLDVSGCVALGDLSCQKNKLTFSSFNLPANGSIHSFNYRNQESEVPIPGFLALNRTVDLSTENVRGGTTYTWFYAGGYVQAPVAQVSEGVFTFAELFAGDEIYCVMVNDHYYDMVVRTSIMTITISDDVSVPPGFNHNDWLCLYKVGLVDVAGNPVKEVEITWTTDTEKRLLALNISNHEVFTGEIDLTGCSSLKTLDCRNSGLTKLNVTNCIALTTLNCSSNKLNTLDVSSCPELTDLNCFNSQLTTLNLDGCTTLQSLDCDYNQLTTLNLNGYKSLQTLNCLNNQLSTLSLNDCTTLQSLNCYNNQLSTLNLNGCTALQSLDCNNNRLIALDVSQCTALTTLNCSSNQLTALDVSKNSALRNLNCMNNKLTFTSLPLPSTLYETYNYGWQQRVPISFGSGYTVDLSSEYLVHGVKTQYSWHVAIGVTFETGFTEENGKFTFTELKEGDTIFCVLLHEKFPQLYLYTTSIIVGVSPAAPPVPSGLSSSTKTQSTVMLSWTNADEMYGFFHETSSYEVRYKKSSENDTEWKTWKVNEDYTAIWGNTITITGLASSTSYDFQVRAANSIGESDWSDNFTITTDKAPAVRPVAPPNDLRETDTKHNSITLTWTDVSDADSYDIRYKSASAENTTANWTIVSASDGVIPELIANTAYHLQIRAVNDAGTSAWSETRAVMTKANGDATAPTMVPPGTLTSTAKTATSVMLEWTAPEKTSGITGYEVQYSTDGKTWTAAGTATGLTRDVTGLAGATQYQFRVRTIGGANSAPSEWKALNGTVTTSAVEAAKAKTPKEVGKPKVKVGKGKTAQLPKPTISVVTLDLGGTGNYSVTINSDSKKLPKGLPANWNIDNVVITINVSASGNSTATISGLPAGKKFSFIVQKIDAEGNKSDAVNVSASTAKYPATKIAAVKSETKMTSVMLRPTAPRGELDKNYDVRYEIVMSYSEGKGSAKTTYYATVIIAQDGSTVEIVNGEKGTNKGGFKGNTDTILDAEDVLKAAIVNDCIVISGLKSATKYSFAMKTLAAGARGNVESLVAKTSVATAKT